MQTFKTENKNLQSNRISHYLWTVTRLILYFKLNTNLRKIFNKILIVLGYRYPYNIFSTHVVVSVIQCEEKNKLTLDKL